MPSRSVASTREGPWPRGASEQSRPEQRSRIPAVPLVANMKGSLGCYWGLLGLNRLGKNNGNERFTKLSKELREALEAEDVVLSGGNAKKLKRLPANIISGSNENALLGGRRERARVEV